MSRRLSKLLDRENLNSAGMLVQYVRVITIFTFAMGTIRGNTGLTEVR